MDMLFGSAIEPFQFFVFFSRLPVFVFGLKCSARKWYNCYHDDKWGELVPISYLLLKVPGGFFVDIWQSTEFYLQWSCPDHRVLNIYSLHLKESWPERFYNFLLDVWHFVCASLSKKYK